MKERMWSTWELLGVFAVGAVIGFVTGRDFGIFSMRQYATKAGVGGYEITDPATGAVEFRWKESK